jgi:preprotein translocase subunit SecG
MENVLLVIHMIACAALVVTVLLQRSEGGALGMSGGGTGGLISGRGAAGVLVKVTMGLAATFILTSLLMTRLNAEQARAPTDVERELQERGADQFDPLALPGTQPGSLPGSQPGATPPATTMTPAPTTPAPAVNIDPLAPITGSQPSPARTPPTPAPTPAPAASQSVPAAPAPAPAAPPAADPAPSPAAPAENGGSNGG